MFSHRAPCRGLGAEMNAYALSITDFYTRRRGANPDRNRPISFHKEGENAKSIIKKVKKNQCIILSDEHETTREGAVITRTFKQ